MIFCSRWLINNQLTIVPSGVFNDLENLIELFVSWLCAMMEPYDA